VADFQLVGPNGAPDALTITMHTVNPKAASRCGQAIFFSKKVRAKVCSYAKNVEVIGGLTLPFTEPYKFSTDRKEMSIIYALVARGKVVLAEYTASSGKLQMNSKFRSVHSQN
jgi:hypothetical protein